MIFVAFNASTTRPQPMSLQEVIDYVWLGQAMLLLAMFGSEAEIRGMIRSGTVAYEMVRPVDLYNFWYCRTAAGRAAPLLLRMAPILIVAFIFFGLKPPPSVASGLLWVAALVGALLLSSAVSTLITITHLWTIAGDGVNRIVPVLIYFFSGLVVPLPLFPEWMQPALGLLPFRGMADTPYRIYMGHIPPGDALVPLLHQLIWTVAFVLFGRWLLSRGTRRLVVQGG